MVLIGGVVTLSTGDPLVQARAAHSSIDHPNLFTGQLIPLPCQGAAFTLVAALSGSKFIDARQTVGCAVAQTGGFGDLIGINDGCAAGGLIGMIAVGGVSLTGLNRHGLCAIALFTSANAVTGDHEQGNGCRAYGHIIRSAVHGQLCSTGTGCDQ